MDPRVKVIVLISIVLGIGSVTTFYQMHLRGTAFSMTALDSSETVSDKTQPDHEEQMIPSTPSFSSSKTPSTSDSSTTVNVTLSGAVRHEGEFVVPGQLSIGELLLQVGILEDADIDSIDLDAPVKTQATWHIPANKMMASHSRSSGVSGPININTATLSELEKLPGVGPSTAKRIMAYRQTHGFFRSASELAGVKGIGEKTVERLGPYLTF